MITRIYVKNALSDYLWKIVDAISVVFNVLNVKTIKNVYYVNLDSIILMVYVSAQ